MKDYLDELKKNWNDKEYVKALLMILIPLIIVSIAYTLLVKVVGFILSLWFPIILVLIIIYLVTTRKK